MPQNWIEMSGVKMNTEIANYILANHFFIILRAEEEEHGGKKTGKKTESVYPWAAYIPKKCAFCGRYDGCCCPRVPVPLIPVHLLAWDFFFGASRPRKSGEVIHHQNGDKMDARIKNLGKGTRRAHGLAHKARRQKFSNPPGPGPRPARRAQPSTR